MANASNTARIQMCMTSSTPTVKWPNYGDVMHDAWLNKRTGNGSELTSKANLTPPHYGTDIPSGGGVKMNVVSYDFNRNCQSHERTGKRWSRRYYAFVSRQRMEHYPERPTNTVGISLTVVGNGRYGTGSGKTGTAFTTLVVHYKTADDPNTLKTANYGQVFKFRWTNVSDRGFLGHYDATLTHASGIIYARITCEMAHGADDFHAIGTYGPSSWSPEYVVGTKAHPVGISSNRWRTLNGGSNEYPITNNAVFFFRPTEADMTGDKKIMSPYKEEKGNSTHEYRVRRYRLSHHDYMP